MELEEFAFQGCPDVRGPHSKKSPQKVKTSLEVTCNSTSYWSQYCIVPFKIASLVIHF